MIYIDRACKKLQQMARSVADNVKKSFITQEYDIDKIAEYTEFIPEWTFGSHEANSVVTYGGYYLQCITSHDAIDGGSGYNPLDGYASVWRMYHSKTAEDAKPFLIRNSEDRYMTGDYCTEYGEVYMCTADKVVYPPSVAPESWQKYGAVVEDDTEPEPETPAIAEWVQPTGSHNAYNIGDVVLFNGGVYKSKINANTWSPTAYPQGWEQIS